MSTAAAEQKSGAAKGLKGVVAADSSICHVDGEIGELIYCGYNIDDLASHATFEEVAWLLFNGDLPTRDELTQFEADLAEARALPDELLDFIKSMPNKSHPMAMLRSAVSYAGLLDPDAKYNSVEAFRQTSMLLTSRIATMVAAIRRVRDGNEPVAPRKDLSLAGNFLYMLNDREPTEDETRSMDVILTIHAEHGLNASTFSARVISATLTDIYSAVTGAIGALKGPLHGGANTAVLETLKEVGSVENVAAWVKEVRAAKGKFMGFGHAVYQTQDPRAKHLKALSEKLAKETGDPIWYDLSVEIEKQVVAEINRNCNVDFYSASLQHYMGIPGDLFTCIFAMSRITGWCAHVIEQISDNKIIRPKANYVGPMNKKYVPVDER